MRARSHKIVFMINSSHKKLIKTCNTNLRLISWFFELPSVKSTLKSKIKTKRKRKLSYNSLRVLLYTFFFPGTSKFDEAFSFSENIQQKLSPKVLLIFLPKNSKKGLSLALFKNIWLLKPKNVLNIMASKPYVLMWFVLVKTCV